MDSNKIENKIMPAGKFGHVASPEFPITCYRDEVERGFGFALIDPGAMANAFEMGDAVLQFVHESSVKYAQAILREARKIRREKQGENDQGRGCEPLSPKSEKK